MPPPAIPYCSAQPCGKKEKKIEKKTQCRVSNSKIAIQNDWRLEWWKKMESPTWLRLMDDTLCKHISPRQSPVVPLGPTLPSHYAWLKWAASISRQEKSAMGNLSLLISSSLGKAPVPKCTDDWFLVRPNQLAVKESSVRQANANVCVLCIYGELWGRF